MDSTHRRESYNECRESSANIFGKPGPSPMHFRFITSTPLNIFRGSGTFAGISILAKFLRISGETVDLVTPTLNFPVYTLERLVFNETLRLRRPASNTVTVGFDMDGYALTAARQRFHIASIKGVIADECGSKPA